MKKTSKTPEPVRQETRCVTTSILDPNFRYIPSAATDITQTWRKFGWKPIERKEKAYESNP